MIWIFKTGKKFNMSKSTTTTPYYTTFRTEDMVVAATNGNKGKWFIMTKNLPAEGFKSEIIMQFLSTKELNSTMLFMAAVRKIMR